MKKLILLFTILISINCLGQVPSYVPTDSLVGWWPFNANANDETGNGHNGTVNGATLTADRFGTANAAYDFDGVDDYISVGDVDNLDGIAQMTWSVWVTPRTIGSYHQVVNKRDFGVQTDYCQLAIGDYSCMNKSVTMSIATVNFESGALDNILIVDSIYHLAIVFNGNVSGNNNILRLYINGENQVADEYRNQNTCNTINMPASTPFNNNILTFAGSGPGTNFLDGILDDIGIWNRALDSTEIQQLYTGSASQDTCTYTDTIIVYDTIAVYDTITYYDTVLVSVTDTLIIDVTLTGEAPPNNMNTLKVYPNPANDIVIIDNGDYSTMTNYTIKIINDLGQEIFNSIVNAQEFQIPVSTFGAEGLYYIQIFDDNNTLLETKKLVLN